MPPSRQAPGSAAGVKDCPAAAPGKLRRILVPIDFSEGSRHALQYAAALARIFRAPLTLLHVIEPLHADMLMDTTAAQRAVRATAHETLARWTEETRVAWPRTTRELTTGHPVMTIVAQARRVQADLVVMGTQGRTGWKRGLLGSVAERVVRHAPCPVLVVPAWKS